MTTQNGFLIVGASLAGAQAAQTLRAEGFDGPITMIGDEDELPYERPPLSKGYLMGKDSREKVFVHPAGWYQENRIDLRLGAAATAVDPAGHEVSLADGDRLGYAKLLLTTGSSPRLLQVPGADMDKVLYLRRISDSDRIKEAFGSASRIAVIGAGWIGLETAAAARIAGLDVTIIEAAELPLLRVLGRDMAEVFAGLHRDHGVDLVFGATISRITGAGGSADGVRLADGTFIDADLVIVGVGIKPNVELAEEAGLAVDNGIVTDAQLRTSDPDIFAAGDVANAYHPLLGAGIRVEHWANALNQPKTAAQAMLGQDVSYDRLPYFYTDQYDLGMEYTGYVALDQPADVVVRGDLGQREFIAFWLGPDSRVLAGMNVNVWDVTDAIKAIIHGGPVDRTTLADPAVPLESVVTNIE